MTRIAIINESTVYSDDQTRALTSALVVQANQHFAPAYGLGLVDIQIVPKGSPVPAGAWVLALLDNADQAGALGYHDITAAGMPLGKVFIKTARQYNDSPEVTASHEMCLTGDTKIPLLDGTSVSVKDLVGRDQFWVYSCKADGSIRPGRGYASRLVRKNAGTVIVTLDNGEQVRCTPDHLFMQRDGSYTEAQSLQPGMSLMPLYRRTEKIGKGDGRGQTKDYEQVYAPVTDDWIFTHRMVKPYCPAGYTRHHEDFNRFNNSPDNLAVIPWETHRSIHAAHITRHVMEFQASGRRRVYSEIGLEQIRENGRKSLAAYNGSPQQIAARDAYWNKPGNREARGELLRQYAGSPENIARLAEMRAGESFRQKNRERIVLYNKSPEHKRIAHQVGITAMALLRNNTAVMAKQREAQRLSLHKRWHLDRAITNPSCSLCVGPVNHKVVSVERGSVEDVFDISVEKYNNFATEAGVFVHNCELLGDPDINLTVQAGSIFVAYEVGDPVESDRFGYKIGDILVSDFVLPAYFETFRKDRSTQFDYCNHVTRPFQILDGGYQAYLDLHKLWLGWQQRFRADASHRDSRSQRPHVGSRRERRRIDRSEWRLSGK